MSDPYGYWRAALAGDFGPVHDGQPQPGFWRAKLDKDSPALVPVAIWEAEGRMLCKVGYQHLFQMRDASDIWIWCCRHPVSHAAYLACCKTHQWPEEEASNFFDEAMKIIQRSEDGGELETLRETLDARRQQENAPILRAKREVDARYQTLFEKIEEAMKTLKTERNAA